MMNKIYLAVGHGTQLNGVWDSGCAYNGYTEAELMLPIVKVAVSYLRASGVDVITDADTNNNKNMTACVAQANKEKVAYYMSVHCDYKDAKSGVAPLYVSNAGMKMAETVGKSVAKAMGMSFKAVKRTNLYELNATNMPAVIFETGAIKADLAKLKQSEKYGIALAEGICEFLGVKMVKHSNAWHLRVGAKKIVKYMKDHNFKYKHSWKDNAVTWTGAKKYKRSTNCSMMVSYALQKKGFLKPGQFFWINGDHITCKGGLTLKNLKKIAVIKHPHKPPKKAGLKKGDIVGYPKTSKHGAHTMIFAGWTKNGNPKWFSTGGVNDIKSGKAHVKKTYTNEPIYTIIRLK